MKTIIIPSVSYEHDFKKKLKIFNGLNLEMVRINFGRGCIDKNIESILFIHKNYPKMRIAIDLPGRKSRIHSLAADIKIANQQTFKILMNPKPEHLLSTVPIINPLHFDMKISKGDIVYFGDNDLIARVMMADEDAIILSALKDGKIKSKSGLLIKEKYQANAELSELERYIAKKTSGLVNEIFLSFADTAQRIHLCRDIFPNQKIVAKIETFHAINNIQSVAVASDGLMLARGDLKNFYSFDDINNQILKLLHRKSEQSNKPFYVATNYFISILTNDHLSGNDLDTLHNTLHYSPNYILLNETCYSNRWLKICEAAQTEIRKHS